MAAFINAVSVETKLRVAAAYVDAREKLDGLRPSINVVAKDCGVEWHFAKKAESKLLISGEVVLPEKCLQRLRLPSRARRKDPRPNQKICIVRIVSKGHTAVLEFACEPLVCVHWHNYVAARCIEVVVACFPCSRRIMRTQPRAVRQIPAGKYFEDVISS